MKESKLYLGETLIKEKSDQVALKTLERQGERYFKIENYDAMPPFFMTIVSDADFWLFISSTGGITAGRKNPDTALFPYETDDKIHDASETTGTHTSIIASKGEKQFLWKPFSKSGSDLYQLTRNLYKNAIGNKIMFEEINHTLELTFTVTWQTSNLYGIIKASELINHSNQNRAVKLLDGIRNILPYGVDTALQSTRSTLVDGYKRSELLESHGLGIFTLSSIISDKAEPSESLKATTVWSKGLKAPKYLLSERQVSSFEKNKALVTETDVKGRRGAFYVSDAFDIEAKATMSWVIVSELNQSATKVEALRAALSDEAAVMADLKADVLKGDEGLKKRVYEADGFQYSARTSEVHRHFSNTLYNIMRGGIYASGYDIEISDLLGFVQTWNKEAFLRHKAFLEALKPMMNYFELTEKTLALNDPVLDRLISEYLPLTYSRRHGDPSRPWNKFNIEVFRDNGEKKLNFEGNWRDIFQNWEALSLSFPGYIESIVSKFVNASTADGYNPYRITKEGVDWEVLDPADPWSNIGYWGDHQVIYLLKLLECSKKYHSNALLELLKKDRFVYANVPYRIKGFEDLTKDPSDTIVFDDQKALEIDARVKALGADGKLIFLGDAPYRVNLLEKLLVLALSKLSNYIPEGGIWMNTQRPEWNDANNALVGNGVSMVTLYYLHRFLDFLEPLLEEVTWPIGVSEEVATFLDRISKVFAESGLGEISDQKRFEMVAELGIAGESYRNAIYTKGFSGRKVTIEKGQIQAFIALVMPHLKDTISKNRRADGLYHAYNLVKFTNGQAALSHLYEMLEGQVAALSSKALSPKEALSVLRALRASAIYRPDQNSYMLYPNRELPRFLSKNILSEEALMSSEVFKGEAELGHTRFVEKDLLGQYRFNGRFRNAAELMEAISETGLYSSEAVLKAGAVFEACFDHHAFTGRSGTFYKYEGLGCIYWHMVSKLLLATQEMYDAAVAQNESPEIIKGLYGHFHEIKAGIGADKSPEAYGAFPTDAYSHTPGFSGVQQPGMTGQVKEDFIARFGELGVSVSQGELSFNPSLLSHAEFLDREAIWQLPDRTIALEKNQLGFTVCSVPIVYEMSKYQAITIVYHNGDQYTFEYTTKLSKEISQSIFNREGKIAKVLVRVRF